MQLMKNHKTSIIIAVALLAIDAILASFDGWKIKENYTPGIITEIIGIVITVAFVDLLFNQNTNKIEKELERKKIIRICRIINLYLPRYMLHFNQLTNHPTDISDCEILVLSNSEASLRHKGRCMTAMNKKQNLFSKPDINVNYVNFSCMYEESRLFISGGFRANIDCFYFYEKKIFEAFNRLLTEVDFKYYKEFEKLVSEFITVSISNDISDFIDYNRKVVYDNGKEIKDNS
jgi:hypothetical protein